MSSQDGLQISAMLDWAVDLALGWETFFLRRIEMPVCSFLLFGGATATF
jgi:hypothetical protein